MVKVFTVGVFDYFHLGHLRLFKNAKKLGDYLIVAVQNGDYIKKYKPDAHILYTTDQRIEILKSIKEIDEVVIYNDVDLIVQKVDFDIFAVGEDQKHEGFIRAIEWCRENGKEVIQMKRTPGISSSSIKEGKMDG